jgi:zinc-ribbon domain
MDVQTERCAHCGTPSLDGARYCTNCGAQLGTEPTNPRIFPSASDTAERVYDVPVPAYAVSMPRPSPAAAAPAPRTPEPVRRRQPGPGLWIAATAALLSVLVVGGVLLLHGGGGGGDGASTPIFPKAPQSTSAAPSTASSTPSSGSSSSSPSSTRVTGPPTNVAGFAAASSPRHLPTGVDFAGHPVTYVAANMVDGRNDTCWRIAGDATGTVLTFRLDQPTRLTRLGLVNGYSKIAYDGRRSYDWYRGNRRILSVQWLFDDGSSVTQRLGFDRALQQTPIKPVTTRVVRLRITSVSPPGSGRAARNDTAISEVLLLGRTG